MVYINLNNTDTVREEFKYSYDLEQLKYLYENAREHIDTGTVRKAFKRSYKLEKLKYLYKLEKLKYLYENAREHIDTDTVRDLFTSLFTDAKIIKYLYENAREHIDTETVREAFKSSYNLEKSKYLYENAREHIDTDTVRHLFTSLFTDAKIIKYLYENAREHIDTDTVREAFKYSYDLEKSKYLYENAREHIDTETVREAFKYSYKLEKSKYLYENAREHIDTETVREAIKYLYKNARLYIDTGTVMEPIKYLFDKFREHIDEKFISYGSYFIKHWHNNQGIYPNINLEVLAKEISEATFSNSTNYDSEAWKIIKENHFLSKPQDLVFIGFNNYGGQWSEELLKLFDNNNKMNYKVYRLSLDDTTNEYLLSFFDAFINPGAGDSFPKDGSEFSLSYLDNNRNIYTSMEHAYQDVINFAKKNNKPYLGICNGAQHLILNEGGYINKVSDHNRPEYHDFVAKSGSIIEFLAMNKEEQSAAIFSGYFPSEIKFSINTQHNYAGVLGKTGNVELGGVSDQNVVEAIARNFYQIGYQFHPERRYQMGEDMIFNRNKNLLFNFIKIINISKNIDINDFSNKLQDILAHAHKNAKCTFDENSCPNPMIVADLFNTNIAELELLGSIAHE